ncbi:MAG: hypothetical protein G01um101456_359 [Parcubacteria group bacterium Gr01-1014_56]|nr:MAG: hypothetical protein G01um101456_359 [Parcubacteria group bacterium Gr01-1014_56]
MNISTIVVGIAALIIGLGGGYFMANSERPAPVQHNMSSTMAGMMAGLEDKEGTDFEQAFINEMIVHHEGAVAMAQMVLQKTERPELVQLANDIISAQTREIDMMRGWQSQWFGVTVHHVQ